MNASLPRLGTSLALAASLSLAAPLSAVQAQPATLLASQSPSFSSPAAELNHVLMVQIPRGFLLDVGANESASLTVPTIADIVINGQKVAPAQTPVLLSIAPSQAGRGAVVRARGLMLAGKLIAFDAEGDLIPSVVINRRELNERVRSSMNLGATIGNGVAGTIGSYGLGTLGASMGDPTGTNLANQMISAGGLLGIASGFLGGRGGKRVVEIAPGSLHLLTIRSTPALIAQLVQMQRDIAAGNGRHINQASQSASR
ncbi:MAG: hypothetical protein VKK62_11230 [Synechococcaceae cyanobacterium]|jgi:hypothetical protein|nr:hypothetical protein [Synechococcaceae cyanobacterium]